MTSLWVPKPPRETVRLMVLPEKPAFCPWCGADLAHTEILTSSPPMCGNCRKRLWEHHFIERETSR